MVTDTLNSVAATGSEALSPAQGMLDWLLSETASQVFSMASFVILVLVLATVAAFGIMLISKLGLRDMAIVEAPKPISQLFECDFCLSWWTCFFLSLLTAAIRHDPTPILAAVVATPLTRRLIV